MAALIAPPESLAAALGLRLGVLVELDHFQQGARRLFSTTAAWLTFRILSKVAAYQEREKRRHAFVDLIASKLEQC